ncbi:MAG TPA: alkaline phosphatase PhoX [Alphaproteobacteria bacterium]|nr:alkaline phosphatase PhoX [Alphaproteobacteria bacterium]
MIRATGLSRRTLLRGGAAALLATGPGLGRVYAAATGRDSLRALGYGPLKSDPRHILDLPQGFGYRIISRTGDPMDDGLRVPGLPDGMHAFPGAAGRVRLLRNHELNPGSANTAFIALPGGPDAATRALMYDRNAGRGGVTTLVYDTGTGKVEREFLSLSGTLRNCAGGATPWGSWISCEETVIRRGEHGAERDHGFNFEVPSGSNELTKAVPLTAMGRFNHEAVGVDPISGVIYQSEDRPDGLFYRFLPRVPGEIARGGRLEALAIQGHPHLFTGNWGLGPRIPVGVRLPVTWVRLESVEAPDDGLRYQGRGRGAAAFARGEGVAVEAGFGDRSVSIWLVCTAGGRNKRGQLWCYRPSPYEGSGRETEQPGTLELSVEPNDSRLLNRGDTICVAPTGDLIVCEDSAEVQRLIGVTREGAIYVLAANPRANSEFAGATFAPDGSTLFVNLQYSGLTFAITGSWNARNPRQS